MAMIRADAEGGAHRRAPGVYIVDVAPLPPREVASGVPLFIGFVPARPDGAPERVTLQSWEDFPRAVGPVIRGSFLGYAVRGFFQNGGARCVVLPVAGAAVPAE